MLKLSAVILTFNEERNIERCLKSVLDVVDEIVVIDSFSQDKTKAICEQYAVKFVEHKFEGHIQQKNWGITQATNPYILSLDADEALSPELKEKILNVKKNWEADGYAFNRLTNYCGQWIKHCGWYPDRQLRLWDSRKGEWQGENPHDRFVMNPGCIVKRLPGNLLHHSFYSIEDHMKTMDFFTTISAKIRFEQGKKPSFVQLLLGPIYKFFRSYILKGGILDGLLGFIICMNSAHSNFLREAKLFRLWHDKKNKKQSGT